MNEDGSLFNLGRLINFVCCNDMCTRILIGRVGLNVTKINLGYVLWFCSMGYSYDRPFAGNTKVVDTCR